MVMPHFKNQFLEICQLSKMLRKKYFYSLNISLAKEYIFIIFYDCFVFFFFIQVLTLLGQKLNM